MLELGQLLDDVPFQLVSLDQVGVHDEVEETGDTFEENARIKAHLSNCPHCQRAYEEKLKSGKTAWRTPMRGTGETT